MSFLRRGRDAQRQVPAVPPEPAGSYSERYRGTEWGQPADPSVWGQPVQPADSSGWERPQAPAGSESDAPVEPEPPVAAAPPPPPAEPGMSFSERYRGTDFAGAVQATGGPKGKKRRGRVKTALSVGSALLALGAVALIGMTVLQGGGLPQIPNLPDVLPSSSPAAPSATPGAVTKAGVINAFIKRVTAKNLGYHVEFSAAFTATAYDNIEVANMAATIDIRGRDFSGNWRVHIYDGRNAETAIVYLGKNGYVRPPEEEWECVPPKTRRPQVNAFAAFKTAKDVRYEGIVTKDGQRLHRLRAVKPLQANPWVLQDDWATSPISGVLYEVLVSDLGVPVSATFNARLRVPDGVARTEMKIAADYRYTNLGRPAAIKAPAGVCKSQTPA